MTALREYDLQGFASRLRAAGMSISTEKLKLLIKRGYFGVAAVCVEMEQDEFVILQKDVEDWIRAHSSPVELPPELAAVVKINGRGEAS